MGGYKQVEASAAPAAHQPPRSLPDISFSHLLLMQTGGKVAIDRGFTSPFQMVSRIAGVRLAEFCLVPNLSDFDQAIRTS